MPQARVVGRAFAVDEVTGEKYLVAEIEIDCPACGTHTFRIAGHHLRAIRDFCISTIDEYPDRTGSEPTQRTTDRYTLHGGGGDPSQN